jgi:hypothetical protein
MCFNQICTLYSILTFHLFLVCITNHLLKLFLGSAFNVLLIGLNTQTWSLNSYNLIKIDKFTYGRIWSLHRKVGISSKFFLVCTCRLGHLKRSSFDTIDSSCTGKSFSEALILATTKVHIFWEGHKILRNLHQFFVLCTASQIIGGDFANILWPSQNIWTLWQQVGHWITILVHENLKLRRLAEHVLYTNWFFLTFRTICVHKKFWQCFELGIFMYWTGNSMDNLLSYCGARISTSEKYSTVQ